MIQHLEELTSSSSVVPAVNQIELSPFLYQRDLIEYCQKRGIAVEAYSPLTQGQRLGDKRLVAVARKYSKTVPQILIRWGFEHGLIEIPKSASQDHIRENAAVFDFEIRSEDVRLLDGMSVEMRRLAEADIPAIEKIERTTTKSPRTGSLGRNVREQLKHGYADACLAAEVDGTFAGFIVGDVRPWEFGEDREVGWIKTVGVDPSFQGHGVGTALGEALLKHFKEKGVTIIRTLVEWHAGDMIAYFKSIGFDRSDLIPLERRL